MPGLGRCLRLVSARLTSPAGPRHSLESMKKLMRYNDYTHDPLSTQLTTCQCVGCSRCAVRSGLCPAWAHAAVS